MTGPTGRVLKLSTKSESPRRCVRVSVRGMKSRIMCVAVLVADAFLGPRPPGLVVRHLDDDPANDNAGNLAYGTHKDNSADAIRNGRTPRGERHGSAKLTEDTVRAIRARHAAGSGVRALAREYGVSHPAVCRLLIARTWGHVK